MLYYKSIETLDNQIGSGIRIISDFEFCDRFRRRVRAHHTKASRTVLFPGDDAAPISSAHNTAGCDIFVSC